tara:strand:+ start:1056 stop:1949 length:894 start_codon:yes stop_codon:yes gene_type:complete
MWRKTGGFAFFFFFQGFTSPDFESAAFRRFCEVCYRVRRFKPTLTLSSLQAIITVAAEEEPVSYDRLAELCGVDYTTAAFHAAILSDGRGRRPGANLLIREPAPGHDRRAKNLVLARGGRAIANLFATVNVETASSADFLKCSILPALRMALNAAPDLNLTTFSVLLFVAQNNVRFAHYGEPAATIADALGLTNLPRNLAKLAEADGGCLLELMKNPNDRRITLPTLTQAGLSLVANIAAVLQDKEPDQVRQPKAESLRQAETPEDVRNFTQADFDVIDVDEIDWTDKAEDKPPKPS